MSCLGTPAVGFGSHGQRSSDRVLATGKAHGWEGTNDPFPKLFQHVSVRVLRHRRRHDAGRGRQAERGPAVAGDRSASGGDPTDPGADQDAELAKKVEEVNLAEANRSTEGPE